MEKRELRFKVERQIIKKSSRCDFTNLVAGSRNYLTAHFIFSEEWEGIRKIALFNVLDEKFSSEIDEEGNCDIPNEVVLLGSFYVQVIGRSDSGTLIVTNTVCVEQKEVR